MSRYYKVVNGCKKCNRKGIFRLDEEEANKWKCPDDSPDCSGEIKHSSWLAKNKSNLTKIGVIAFLFFVIVFVLQENDSDKLRHKVDEFEKNTQTYSFEVRKIPQNTGTSNPYKLKWISKYANRIKHLEACVDPFRNDIEKLNELQRTYEVEITKLEKLAVPDFEPEKPLKKYTELKSDGIKLLSQIRTVLQQAKMREKRDIVARSSRCEREVNAAINNLNSKAKPLGGPYTEPDPQEIILSNVAKLKSAKEDVLKAIIEENERLKKLEDEKRALRLAEIKKQQLLTEQQRHEKWNSSTPEFSIKVSDPLRASLIDPLIRSYFEKNGAASCELLMSPSGESVVRYTDGSYSVDISSGQGLQHVPVEIEIRDRATSKKNSRVIAMDAMVVVAGAEAPPSIAAGDLEKVIAGNITNWKEIGGQDSNIVIISPSPSSGDFAVLSNDIQALLSKNLGKTLSSNVATDSSNSSAAFGLCAFHNSRGKNRLSVSASKSSSIFAPTPSAISAENYRYAKRVYADVPDAANAALKKFIEYVESGEGQNVVARSGFIDLRIELVSEPLDEYALPIIAKAFGVDISEIVSAYRLNTNFRFATNSAQLDAKAEADIERVQQTLKIHIGLNKKALIIGFADTDGTDKLNLELSENRSRQVMNTLISEVRDVSGIKSAGEGEKYPISDNDTEVGKSQNRRVEVWIVELN